MILAEAGYDHATHDGRIKAIMAEMPLPIAIVIERVAAVYSDLYGLSPQEINDGMCEDFAYDLAAIMGGGEVLWADEMPDGDWATHGAHAFLKLNGGFYDSETPRGEDDWTMLPFFTRQ